MVAPEQKGPPRSPGSRRVIIQGSLPFFSAGNLEGRLNWDARQRGLRGSMVDDFSRSPPMIVGSQEAWMLSGSYDRDDDKIRLVS